MFLVLRISKIGIFCPSPPRSAYVIYELSLSLILWMPVPLPAKVLLAMFAPVNFSIIRTGIRLQLSAFCCSKATLVIDLNFSIWLRSRAIFDLILALKVCSFSWSNRFSGTFYSCCQKCQKTNINILFVIKLWFRSTCSTHEITVNVSLNSYSVDR